MSNSRNIQPGHYRTYKESGKTIEVNGGPKSKPSVDIGQLSGYGAIMILIMAIIQIVIMITVNIMTGFGVAIVFLIIASIFEKHFR